MGQRSQLYVRIDFNDDHKRNTGLDKLLIAEYLQWNYGERMISRAAALTDYVASEKDFLYMSYVNNKIPRIIDTNFDMGDVQLGSNLINEYINQSYIDTMKYNKDDFFDWVFVSDNNDGRFLLHIDEVNDTIKYAFLDTEMNLVMTPEQYLVWNADYDEEAVEKGANWVDVMNKRLSYAEDKELVDIIKTARKNISTIKDHAQLMTAEEVQQFLHDDYSDVVAHRIDEIVRKPEPAIKEAIRKAERAEKRKAKAAAKERE